MGRTACPKKRPDPFFQAAFLCAACLSGEAGAQTALQLHDVTASSGVAFQHTDGSSGRRYIVETVTAGLALLDYDGDGRIDIYFLNGAPLEGTPAGPPPPRNALYRNEGDGRFRDVTAEAGVGDTGFGMGVTVGDYDNDGFPDVYVNNFGHNVLYRNNGDGTYADVTAVAGVDPGWRVGAGAAFLDIEGDGDLDLYVANYVKFTYATHVARTIDGFPEYAGPKDYPPEPDCLYRNNGDGTFTDISREAGITAVAGSGMGMVCADYDRDGDTDIFVLNDVNRNFLFRNDGQGHFAEVATESGLAYNLDGHELGSMGVDCGDYDNDGWLDFFMTSYAGELPVLYRNLRDGFFEDTTLRAGAAAGLLVHVNWGCGLVDFDNDGDRDLFVANGHLQDNIDQYSDTYTYKARNVLLQNDGRGRFTNVSDQAGDGLRGKHSARGAGFDDLDNDGDCDVVVLNSREAATVLRNDTCTGQHWLQIELRGLRANRDGVGSQVQVTAGNRTQVAEVHSGRGYQSHWGSRLQFGLGISAHVDRIEIRWLGGGVEVLSHVGADRRVVIIESTGQARLGLASGGEVTVASPVGLLPTCARLLPKLIP